MTLFLDDGDVTLLHGDAATVLADLPEGSVDCVVTSPPYFGLRDYGYPGQIGLEPTPEEYVAALVAVFRQVRRVLAPWGTCWVNIGDSYSVGHMNGQQGSSSSITGGNTYAGSLPPRKSSKPKDLLLMPARLALALQADGWWVRSRIVWAKPNPMPESVTDRPTSAHEDIYLMTKAARYWYDAEAVREPATYEGSRGSSPMESVDVYGGRWKTHDGLGSWSGNGRNLRNVWSIATEPTPEAHFATFPTELVRRCLAAGCPERVCRECGEPSRRIVDEAPDDRVPYATVHSGRTPSTGAPVRKVLAPGGGALPSKQRMTLGWTDCGHDKWRPGIVLDPFVGSGKTAQQARRMGLHAVGIDASAEYLAIAAKRLQQLSLLGGVA